MSFHARAERPFLEIKESDDQLIERYLKIQSAFSKEACRPGTEEKFWKLFYDFRGEGYFIPLTVEGKLDRAIVNRFIPELINKKRWINTQLDEVKKLKDFNQHLDLIDSLRPMLNQLMSLKEQIDDGRLSDEEKIKIYNHYKYLLINFKTNLTTFFNKTPFLLSYRYPVDHFELRENYDKSKNGDKDSQINQSRKNEIYFYRKIVQDGAQNSNHTGSDSFLRAAIDTISLRLKNVEIELPEELRFDIQWALNGLERQLRSGKSKIVERLTEWVDRTDETINFYESVRNNKIKVKDHFETGDQLIAEQSKAKHAVQQYVWNKLGETYRFWRKRADLMQALFVLETILFNEVGTVDGESALERRDVLQVVLNRYYMDEYSIIPKDDVIFNFIADENQKEKVDTNRWLNLMMKEGEFSFTYFFIHGNVRIYCPDMTRIGKKLRKTNLKLAIEALRSPRPEFKAVRYFSRASMLGRIDMSSIWSDFAEIGERPGLEIKRDSKLFKALASQKYTYHYSFLDQSGQRYKVLEIDDEVVVFSPRQRKFFTHRSPHFFRYYEPRPSS